jgi:hypothetical protein
MKSYEEFVAEVQASFSSRSNPPRQFISEPDDDDDFEDDDCEEPQVLELDDSPATGPVSPELAALTVAPEAPLDHVAIAVAVLGAMDLAEIREVLVRLDDQRIAVIREFVMEMPR